MMNTRPVLNKAEGKNAARRKRVPMSHSRYIEMPQEWRAQHHEHAQGTLGHHVANTSSGS